MDLGKAIEDFFRGIVRSLGGTVLDESPDGKTADFKFPGDNMIVELKTMCIDTSEETNRKVADYIAEWTRTAGRIPTGTQIGENVLFQLATIEPEIVGKWLNLLRQYVERQVKDANAQIADTKQREAMPNARGILLVCNPNNVYYNDPHSYRLLIADILRKRKQDGSLRYSHIQGAVYFSTNEVTLPGNNGYFWTPLQMKASPEDDVSDIVAFQRKLRDDFYRHIRDTLGIEVRQHEVQAGIS